MRTTVQSHLCSQRRRSGLIALPRSIAGELDCVGTLARFPLDETLERVHNRRHDVARPLLSVLVLLRSVAPSRSELADATEASRVRREVDRMLALVRELSNASGVASGLANKVSLVLTDECNFPDEVGASLDAMGVRRGCLTCSWNSVNQRGQSETEEEWAERIYREGTLTVRVSSAQERCDYFCACHVHRSDLLHIGDQPADDCISCEARTFVGCAQRKNPSRGKCEKLDDSKVVRLLQWPIF